MSHGDRFPDSLTDVKKTGTRKGACFFIFTDLYLYTMTATNCAVSSDTFSIP